MNKGGDFQNGIGEMNLNAAHLKLRSEGSGGAVVAHYGCPSGMEVARERGHPNSSDSEEIVHFFWGMAI